MKVIDLLNKIAKGEDVPKKIAIQNKVLIYNEDEILNLQDYYIEEDDEDATWEIWAYKIDDEIEIIEDTPKEDKKIEKLKEYVPARLYLSNNNYDIDLRHCLEKTGEKLNEIIDMINGE